MKTILDYIEEERSFYDTQTIPLQEGDNFSQKELIKAINYAHRSKYLDEASDDIIGDYPYDNISKYRVRLEARATDFDTKHIEVEPKNGSREARIAAMIATKALQKHMRDIKFGKLLNRYADTRPEYGGVLLKRTDGAVHVVPWENVITDMSDILGGAIIERHYMRPSELKKTGWKNVDLAIQGARDRRRKDLDKASKEAKTITHLIEVWELHGEVPKSLLLDAEAQMNGTKYDHKDEDDKEYVRVQVICAPEGKNEQTGEMEGKILQANEETDEDFPYMYDCRNPVTGRGLGEGIPEELSEHQRWHNFYKTEEARAVSIGGKVVFVTDDGNVVDTIYDEGIEHGTILKVGEGKEIKQLNTFPSSAPVFQSIRQEWDQSADKNTSSFSAVIGEEGKANVPFKAQYLQDVNGSSQFLKYREDMGLFLGELVENWLLPDALTKAADDDEIYETFSKAELQLIDEVIVRQRLIEERKRIYETEQRAISGPELEAMQIGIQTQLDRQGNKRTITQIKDFIKKEVLGKVIIHTTDEQRSKAVLFESYSNLLGLFAEDDPARFAIRDRILDQMGVTKDELSLYAEEAKAVAAAAVPANAEMKTEAIAAQEGVRKAA